MALISLYLVFAGSLPMPWVNIKEVWCALCWLVYFFGGVMIPILVGWMINSVPYNLRGSANSAAQFCYNAFGYMPAPYIYGLMSALVDDIKDIDDQKKNYYHRFPMCCVLYFTVFAVIFLTRGYMLKYHYKLD